jgi:hypothetical protein
MPDIHFSSSAGSTMRLDGTSPTDDPAFRHRREWTQDPPRLHPRATHRAMTHARREVVPFVLRDSSCLQSFRRGQTNNKSEAFNMNPRAFEREEDPM